MTKLIGELSVFFPAYNEEKNIKKTVLDSKEVLEKISNKWEIIIVDDGSVDKTGKISDELEKKYKKNIRAIHHKQNRGYGSALKTGFENSKYKWVAFTDSDGQFDFSEIKNLINTQKATSADLVLGIRKQRADSFIRVVFTFVWSKLLPRILFGLNIKDYSCGFKLIKRDVYKNVLPLIGEEKVTQMEMLVKAKKKGYKIAEVNVKHLPRKFGKQTGANLNVVLKSIADLLKLWKQLK